MKYTFYISFLSIAVNSSSCDPSQFQCGNGACLENKFRCDNKADCADKSDEHNCYGEFLLELLG